MCRAIVIWAIATHLFAQSINSTTRPAASTVTGDTGLWFIPTAEALPAGRWSVAACRVNADFDQGFTDVSNWPVTFALGVRDRLELFGAMTAVTRIDRDVRPLFEPSAEPGRASGVVNEYPFVEEGWTGSHVGDLSVGAKLSLVSEDRAAVSFGVRGMVKLPTANADTGGTGRLDVAVDAIVSREIDRRIQLSVVSGFIRRGDPQGIDLLNGVRWGVGVGLPTRSPLRLTSELHGEAYTGDAVDATGVRIEAIDRAPVPRTSAQTSPVNAAIGLTWIGSRGVFVGAGLNWNLRMRGRSEFGAFRDRTGDALGLEVRVGYHPGAPHRGTVPPSPSRQP